MIFMQTIDKSFKKPIVRRNTINCFPFSERKNGDVAAPK